MVTLPVSVGTFDYWSIGWAAAYSAMLITRELTQDVGSYTFLGGFVFIPEPNKIRVNKEYRLSITDIVGAMGDRVQWLGQKAPMITIIGSFFRDYNTEPSFGRVSLGDALSKIATLSAMSAALRRSLPFFSTATGDFRLVYIRSIDYENVEGRPGDINYVIRLIQDFTRGGP